MKESRIVKTFLPCRRFFALPRHIARSPCGKAKNLRQGNRRRHCCSYGAAKPFGERASIRRVMPGPKVSALGFLSYAHRPRSVSLDRSAAAPRRQWPGIAASHAKHSILGAIDSSDWRLRRAAQQLLSGARVASCVCQRRRYLPSYPLSRMLGQQLSICYGSFDGMWRE